MNVYDRITKKCDEAKKYISDLPEKPLAQTRGRGRENIGQYYSSDPGRFNVILHREKFR